MPERLERSEGPVINALLTFVEMPRLHGSWGSSRVEPVFRATKGAVRRVTLTS